MKRWIVAQLENSKQYAGAQATDIFNMDKLFFPINFLSSHWVCVVVKMQEKEVEFLDSLGDRGIDYAEAVFKLLRCHHFATKGKVDLPDLEKWQLIPSRKLEVPSQDNGK